MKYVHNNAVQSFTTLVKQVGKKVLKIIKMHFDYALTYYVQCVQYVFTHKPHAHQTIFTIGSFFLKRKFFLPDRTILGESEIHITK